MRGWRDYLWITWWRSLWDGRATFKDLRERPRVPARTPKERLLQRLDEEFVRHVPDADSVVFALRHWLDTLDGHLDLSRCDRAAVRQLPPDLIGDFITCVTERSGHEQLRITLPPGMNRQLGWWSRYGLG
jgi:hypothetical protein